jgi:hypothetical protein
VYVPVQWVLSCAPLLLLLLLLLPLLQIDMITYENVTSASPVWPALMGINAQLSFIAHAVASECCAGWAGGGG